MHLGKQLGGHVIKQMSFLYSEAYCLVFKHFCDLLDATLQVQWLKHFFNWLKEQFIWGKDQLRIHKTNPVCCSLSGSQYWLIYNANIMPVPVVWCVIDLVPGTGTLQTTEKLIVSKLHLMQSFFYLIYSYLHILIGYCFIVLSRDDKIGKQDLLAMSAIASQKYVCVLCDKV